MPRAMEIVTPLGPDVLLFHRMHGRDELSRLSDCRVELLSHPDHGDIEIDKVLGQNVTITLAMRDEGTRYFNGFVTRFGAAGKHGRYNRFIASVQPWTWFLTRTADCRIFQEMTVPDIVKAVFAEHPMADFKFDLTSSYRKWTYCVQYRETDFNFISRLLEHEGIFYYFQHTDGHHKMMLTDSTDKLTEVVGYEVIKAFTPEQFVRPEVEYISQWDFAREVQPGLFVHTDYDMTRPTVNLLTQKSLPRTYTPSDYEFYDYPGYYLQKPDGEHYAAVRIDEFGTQFETAHAVTNARGVTVGALFTLDGYPRADQNREHVIIGASYDMQFSDYEAMPTDEGPPTYSCRFAAMSSDQQFRPKRATPKPFVQGPQTAAVVGPAGDEIYTDEHGRVKVKFHWDRDPKKDQNSSCWIRVSQMWAGKGWGSVSTPRIGHEVIVDFLEGDPDQPIILGSVHNAVNPPPHTGVVSGLKSNTHKGRGFNQMTMDDTAGKEKITIHAQYDMNTKVLHDQTTTVINDQVNTISGKLTEEIDKDTSITIKTGKLEHKVNTGTADYFVKAAVTQQFDDTLSTTAKNKISITSGTNEIVIDGKTKITLVTGSSQLVMESNGTISLTGTKITVDGKNTVNMLSDKTEVIGKTQALFGTDTQTVATNASKTSISGLAIAASASGTHEITGSVVKIN